MFYHFRQNNSGGSFDLDKCKGVTRHVIIEGDDFDSVLLKAEEIGIYFDGCSKGIDCYCCGDRWYEPWEGDGKETPMIYGSSVADYFKVNKWGGPMLWMEKGREICIHYKDGTIEWH